MEQSEGWSLKIAEHVGRRVAYFRERAKSKTGQKLTTLELANRTRALGYPLDRSVIAKLESGHRQSITLPELVVLAKALEVPPLLLLYPLGAQADVEVLPGRFLETEAAMLWFTGWNDQFKDESTVQVGRGNFNPETDLYSWYETGYQDAGAPIELYADHRQAVAKYIDAFWDARRLLGKNASHKALSRQATAFQEERGDLIRRIRADMRRRGITVLPELPAELEHLDSGSQQ